MEHYERCKVVVNDIDFKQMTFHESVIHMKVHPGTRTANVIGYALSKFKNESVFQLSWSSMSGGGISKASNCADIMKRKFKNLHQITRKCHQRIEEYWQPNVDGLEKLKVNRDIPAIIILLSKIELDNSDPGYEGPNTEKTPITDSDARKRYNGYSNRNNKYKINDNSACSNESDPNTEKTHITESDAGKKYNGYSNRNNKYRNNDKSACYNESGPNTEKTHITESDAGKKYNGYSNRNNEYKNKDKSACSNESGPITEKTPIIESDAGKKCDGYSNRNNEYKNKEKSACSNESEE